MAGGYKSPLPLLGISSARGAGGFSSPAFWLGIATSAERAGRGPKKRYVETEEEELLWIIYAAYDAGYLDGYIN